MIIKQQNNPGQLPAEEARIREEISKLQASLQDIQMMSKNDQFMSLVSSSYNQSSFQDEQRARIQQQVAAQ